MVQYLSNNLYIFFIFALSMDEDVIEVYYHNDIKFLCQDLANIILGCSWYISESKRHDLVLEVAIAGPEGRLLFVSFLNPHWMIGISQINLDEPSSLI